MNKIKPIKFNKGNITYIPLALFLLAFSILGVKSLSNSFAASSDAAFSLTPTTGTYSVGTNIVISVGITSSSGDNANAVQANLSYPASKLTYVSTSITGPFTLCAQNSGGSGTVTLACASPTAESGTQSVASVTFSVASSGAAAVSMTSGSDIDNTSGNSVWNGVLPSSSYTLSYAAPTVSISGLTTNSYIHSNAMPITVSAVPNDGGSISSCSLSVNSTVVSTLTSAFNFNLNTLGYNNGAVNLAASCTDNLGATGEASLSVIVNNGDINDDGVVNLSDLSILASHWAQTDAKYADGNITGDSTINLSDLAVLAANWKWTAP